MSNPLTMPTLTVAFQQRAQTAVARSQKGTVALLLRDAGTAGQSWAQWSETHREDLNAIVEKYA